MRIITLVLSLVLLTASSAFADLNSSVQDMFNRLGLAGSSTTSPGIYETQSRGYVTGGSLSIRTPYDTLQPFTVSLPNIHAGCQGIDVFLGGFSYINVDDLIQKLKIIGTSALAYGFMLAIKTLCPSCYDVMQWLEDVSRSANSLAMNTCRAGESVARGVFGLASAVRSGQWGRCAQIGNSTGGFSDFIQAWRGCADDLTSGMASATGDDIERANPQGNLVWKGLKQLNIPEDLAQYIMSTMGTVIVTNDSAMSKSPLLTVAEFVNGGTVMRYQCDDTDQCLNPTQVSETIDGFKQMVKSKLDEAFMDIITKTEPSDDIKQFINALPSPIWKFLNVVSGYPVPAGESYIEQYSDSIAVLAATYWFDMAFRHTIQGLHMAGLKGVAGSKEALDAFYRDAEQVYKIAYEELNKTEVKLKSFDSLLTTLDFLEKRLTQNLESSGVLAQYNFGKDNNKTEIK
jgi:conjugative transfer pilus assembly protein TraH